MPPIVRGLGRSVILRKAVSVSLPYTITASHASTASPDHVQTKLPPATGTKNAQRFREFNLQDRIFAVTGGARGLGLTMAEALMEAGANGSPILSFFFCLLQQQQQLLLLLITLRLRIYLLFVQQYGVLTVFNPPTTNSKPPKTAPRVLMAAASTTLKSTCAMKRTSTHSWPR